MSLTRNRHLAGKCVPSQAIPAHRTPTRAKGPCRRVPRGAFVQATYLCRSPSTFGRGLARSRWPVVKLSDRRTYWQSFGIFKSPARPHQTCASQRRRRMIAPMDAVRLDHGVLLAPTSTRSNQHTIQPSKSNPICAKKTGWPCSLRQFNHRYWLNQRY